MRMPEEGKPILAKGVRGSGFFDALISAAELRAGKSGLTGAA